MTPRRLSQYCEYLAGYEKSLDRIEYDRWHFPFYNEEWEDIQWLSEWRSRGSFADLEPSSGDDIKPGGRGKGMK